MIDFTFLTSTPFFIGLSLLQFIMVYLIIKPLRVENYGPEKSRQEVKNKRLASTSLLASGLFLLAIVAVKKLKEAELFGPPFFPLVLFISVSLLLIVAWWYFMGFKQLCSWKGVPFK